jgi:3-isopropylmalate/(R)-2-methylmalate dehydratase small subunit
MKLRGKVIKYGEDVNTDVIIPSKYLVYTDPNDLARYAMEGIDSSFLKKVKDRQIIVAARNFGCGSSREQAPIALKYAGVEAIVAESFARIFYRNAVNIGLQVLECPEVAEDVEDGDEVEVDMSSGIVRNITKGKILHGNPTPEFLLRIMDKGLVQYIREARK